MAAAGSSGTPLPKKLGIKEGHRVWVRGGPPDLLPDVPVVQRATAPTDVAVLFVTTLAELRTSIERVHRVLAADGGCWIAWPKRSSGVATELTEDVVRNTALAETVLVDNKVCAIDDVWSGLRLVARKEDRATWAVPPTSRG